jgi:hypothetical protein
MPNTRSKLPLFATLAYLLVGSGWIIIGFFISSTIDEGGETSLFELYKGLAFIAVTGLTLFIVLRWMDGGPAGDGSFKRIADEFRHSIRIGERTLRWLPPGLAAIILTLVCLLLLGLAWTRESALVAGEQSASALRYTIATQTGNAMRVVDLTLEQDRAGPCRRPARRCRSRTAAPPRRPFHTGPRDLGGRQQRPADP